MMARRRRRFGAITPRDLYVRSPGGGIIAPHGRPYMRRETTWKWLRSEVGVIRTGGTGKKAFQACVSVGGLRPGRVPSSGKTTSGFSRACMFGKNPREALAATFARVTRQMKKRSGAFAGVR
jgi:hypothetical protein